MPFSDEERLALLTVKGVGPTVIKRLEEMGFSTLEALGQADTTTIVAYTAAQLGASCWKNSHQARTAIDGAIALARSGGAIRAEN
jgi:predicted RecB family nuclease